MQTTETNLYFQLPECNTSYEREKYLNLKTVNAVKILRITNKIFR
jgi:hypothetical protein